MNLAIDIGNTLAKAAVVENGQVDDLFKTEHLTPEYVSRYIFGSYPDIVNGILVSTRGKEEELQAFLRRNLRYFLVFDHRTPVPVVNRYGTPETLGCDRLAAAVGANALLPESNVLIVDFGTAITIDVVTAAGEFIGGNISPGASLRFRALHEFTGRLPLRKLTENTEFLGRTSFSAIEGGVVNGIVYEIEGYIAGMAKRFDNYRIVFTGGDGNFFAKRFKNPIFATCDLVVYGLNKILEYNVQQDT